MDKEKIKDVEDMNVIILQGTIVGTYSIGRMTILNLSTGKAGVATTGKNVTNYPSVVFLGKAASKAASFKKYDNVKVFARAAYGKRKNPDGSVYFQQTIYGDSIEETPKKMSALGVDFGGYEEPRNEVLLKGTVTSVRKTAENIRTIYMQTQAKNGFKNAVDVICYQPGLMSVADKIKKNDEIGVVGTLQTKRAPQKDGSKKFIYFQNLVADEVKIITSAPTEQKNQRATEPQEAPLKQVSLPSDSKIAHSKEEAELPTKRIPVEPSGEKPLKRRIKLDENGNPIKRKVVKKIHE